MSQVQRSHLHSRDLYYLLLLQRPYRCSSCGTRFFRPSWIGAAYLRSWFEEPDEEIPAMELTGDPLSSHEVNRRAWIRFNCDLGISCQRQGTTSDCHWPARIKDVSRGGARMLFHRSFENETILHIQLDGLKSEAPSVLHGRVVHCGKDDNGRWSVGLEFVEPLASEELEALLA
jgi:hypothetical protein